MGLSRSGLDIFPNVTPIPPPALPFPFAVMLLIVILPYEMAYNPLAKLSLKELVPEMMISMGEGALMLFRYAPDPAPFSFAAILLREIKPLETMERPLD